MQYDSCYIELKVKTRQVLFRGVYTLYLWYVVKLVFFKGGMSNTKFRLEGPTRVFKEVGNFLFLKLGEKYLDAPFMYFIL